MLDKLRMTLVITRREVRDLFRDWRIIFPIVILTVIFPGLMNFTAGQAVAFVQKYGANLIADRFTPFLLMIVGFFPITSSMAIALESFAGESERKSIEPLLSTPVNDWQLYVGKLLASLVPPILASLLGIAVYLYGVFRTIGWQAEPILLVQIILLTMVQALVMVSGAVVVSTQTTSVRAANLLASFIIIPMSILIQGESIVMFWGSYNVLWWIIFAMGMIAVLLVRAGIAHFNREELLGRELDVLNVRKSWLVFKRAFVGEAQSVRQWFTHEVPRTISQLGIPMICMTVLLGVGLWMGATISDRLGLPSDIFNLEQMKVIDSGIITGELRQAGIASFGGAFLIAWHNLQTVLIATAAGIFSCGVLGVLVLMIPMALLGFFAELAGSFGYSRLMFLAAFTLPHGIFEFPAMIITGAIILRVGATMVTPAHGQTISDAWLCALADWAKIILVFVIPLFIIAAFFEVFITPQTMPLLLGM